MTEQATASGPVRRFNSRPTQGDIIRNTVAITRRSVLVTAVGTVIVATSAVAFILIRDAVSGLFVLLGIGFLSGWVMAPLAWWSVRQRRDLVLAEVEVAWDDAALSVTTPFAQVHVAWGTFRGARETAHAFLLDTGAGSVNLIPKRGVAPDDIAAFRETLAARGLLDPRETRHHALRRLGAVVAGLVVAAIMIGLPLLLAPGNTATIDVVATPTGDTVTVVATTDLPDGTMLGLQVYQRDEWEREIADGVQPDIETWPWQWHETVVVFDGKASATVPIADWPSGPGLAVAYFWVDANQPAAVIERFGVDASGLRGPNVVDDPAQGPTLQRPAGFQIGP